MTLLQNLWSSSGHFNISIIFAVLALVACGTPQPAQVAANPQAASKVNTPEIDMPEIDMPEIDTTKIDTPEIDTPEIDTPEKLGAPEPLAKIYTDPNHITGVDRRVLVSLLGEPGFMRRDAPAEIWQYKTLSCTLDVFLYKDAVGPAYRVAHFETRGMAPTTLDCVVSVVRNAHDKPAG